MMLTVPMILVTVAILQPTAFCSDPLTEPDTSNLLQHMRAELQCVDNRISHLEQKLPAHVVRGVPTLQPPFGINLQADDAVILEFPSKEYRLSDKMEGGVKLHIGFVTTHRNQQIFGFSGPKGEEVTISIENDGSLKLYLFEDSNFGELIIADGNFSDGKLHHVNLSIAQLVTYSVDKNLAKGTLLLIWRTRYPYVYWETFSVGRDASTGFVGCITSLDLNSENILDLGRNTNTSAFKLKYFKSGLETPNDLKMQSCGSFILEQGSCVSPHVFHNGHHHEDNRRDHVNLGGINYERKFLEKLHADLQQYLRENQETTLPKIYDYNREDNKVDAFCDVRPNRAFALKDRHDVRGRVTFKRQESSKLVVRVQLRGLPATKIPIPGAVARHIFGMHIHESSNLSRGCDSIGSHFNPHNKSHGRPNSPDSHLGDFGNIESNLGGMINRTFEFVKEGGEDFFNGSFSIIGRALAIHAKEDDLGLNDNSPKSKVNGNAGPILACCVIVRNRDDEQP